MIKKGWWKVPRRGVCGCVCVPCNYVCRVGGYGGLMVRDVDACRHSCSVLFIDVFTPVCKVDATLHSFMPGVTHVCLASLMYAWCHSCMPGVTHVCLASLMYAWRHSCMPVVTRVCLVSLVYAWRHSCMPLITHVCLVSLVYAWRHSCMPLITHVCLVSLVYAWRHSCMPLITHVCLVSLVYAWRHSCMPLITHACMVDACHVVPLITHVPVDETEHHLTHNISERGGSWELWFCITITNSICRYHRQHRHHYGNRSLVRYGVYCHGYRWMQHIATSLDVLVISASCVMVLWIVVHFLLDLV